MTAAKTYASLGQGLGEAAPSTRWHAGRSFPMRPEVWLHLFEAWRANGS
jgi:hypothetical protein